MNLHKFQTIEYFPCFAHSQHLEWPVVILSCIDLNYMALALNFQQRCPTDKGFKS